MPDPQYEYQQSLILQMAHKAMIADAVAPQFAVPALEGFAVLARVGGAFQ